MKKNTSFQSQPIDNWHFLSVNDIYEKIRTNPQGLSNIEAGERLQQYGANELKEEAAVSPFTLFINQFTSILIIILFIAAVLSAFIGEGVEAVAIIIIVILAGVLGFLQEYQANKAIDALKKMTAPFAVVLRDGKECTIPARNMVPGDIILLKTGDKIPADARLTDVKSLKVDESPLTGESMPVDKITAPMPQGDVMLADKLNMVFMGTAVSYGRGKAVVLTTGMSTEFGRIASLLQSAVTRKTPLQSDLDKVGKMTGIFSILLAAFTSLFGIFRGYDIIEMFIWGVALAVAVIPEALPAVVTISLALGVRRMAKRRALIRKLPAVETLGATTIICSDKTGTLTQNEMTVRNIYVNHKSIEVTGSGYVPQGDFLNNGIIIDPRQNRELLELLYVGVLCNDAVLEQKKSKWEVLGDPTEGGILVAAKKAGIDCSDISDAYPRINEIPFSSERRRMTTIHRYGDDFHAFSKGAVETILETCPYISRGDRIEHLTENDRKQITDAAHIMGEKALRVLGFSEKHIEHVYGPKDPVESEMVFLGLMGMIDPPRPEAKDAILLCEQAGIKPVMITGDHKITAVAVARELGILKDEGVMSGPELEQLSDAELEQKVESVNVYARIAPVHKMRIVTAFMNRGHVVAMTGDGVNDAPSLKKADIGVAMGITGTDVSKEAADMILTDDNFASIVSAVEEGRSVFENIRKYLIFLLSGNMATVFAMICALMFSFPLPLSAIQILFINFIMDGLIAIALGVEPPEPGIMRKRPRNVHEGILTLRTISNIGFIGSWIAIVTVFVFLWELRNGYPMEHAMTVFFATLILSRLFNGFNCRSMEDSLIKLGLFSNIPLIVSTVTALFFTYAVIYFPFLQVPFGTTYLSLREITISLSASSTVLVMAEIHKLLKRNISKFRLKA